MAQQQESQIRIVNGPSKFDLMVALFNGDLVKITIQTPKLSKQFDVNLLGVSSESGSRESWFIHGYFTEPHRPAGREINWSRFEGYYDPRTRKGWLRRIMMNK